VWWWCAIFLGLQTIMLAFGFEETKFTGHLQETIEGRQGSIVDMPAEVTVGEKGEKGEKHSASPPSPASDAEGVRQRRTSYADDAERARKLSTIHVNHAIPRKTYWQRMTFLTTSPGPWSHFLRHSYQPFLILVTIPGVLFCSLTYAVLLAYSTVMTTALSIYMIDPPYNFSASQIGLMSLAPFIGTTIGALVVGPVSDWLALRLAKRNKGIYEPEMRFWVFVPFIPFMLAGSWWFGYALAQGKPWSQVAVAYGISNFGSAPLQTLALTYLLDAYGGTFSFLPMPTQWLLTRVRADAHFCRNHRRRSHSPDVRPQPLQHHLRLRHAGVGRRGRCPERVQHDWRHRHGDSELCVLFHLEGQAFAGEDGEDL